MKLLSSLITTAAFLTTNISCMQQPDMQDVSTPTTTEAVQNSLVDGWGTVSPLTMLKGDFIYQETDQQIDTMDPKLALQEGTTVSNITETDTEYDYTFLYQSALISGDSASQSTREDHRSVLKKSSAATLTSKSLTSKASIDAPLEMVKNNISKLKSVKAMSEDLQMTLGFERLLMLAQACEMTDSIQDYCKNTLKVDSCEISCTNLNTFKEVRPAPSLIKEQTNCGGLTDCKLNVTNVSFDWTILLKTGGNVEKQKINYSIAMTQDLPFLPRVLDYCSRGLVQIPNSTTKVLVTVCNRLKNFKRASN